MVVVIIDAENGVYSHYLECMSCEINNVILFRAETKEKTNCWILQDDMVSVSEYMVLVWLLTE